MPALAPISAAVGDGAPNRPLDVAVVQDLLNRWPDGRARLPVDGMMSPLVLARIAQFQADVGGSAVPDRQVTPRGRTLALLVQMASPSALPAAAPVGAGVLACLDPARFARSFRTALQTAAPGLEALLAAVCRDAGITDLRSAAYMLATALHETAGTCAPVAEAGRGAGRDYGTPQSYTDRRGKTVQQIYYGRGYVQLTWLANYLKIGQAIGLGDGLAIDPDRALQPDIAYLALSRGMRDGLFSGRKLGEFITGANCDYPGARQVVNAMDAADAIAANAVTIEQLLRVATHH